MLKDLGNTYIDEGDLITLYLEDNSAKTEVLILVAKTAINLSIEMANYYELIKGYTQWIMSDKAIHGFADYLVEKALAYRPKSTSVKVGDKNRPSKRILDEYKYRLNPKAFSVKMLEEKINDTCAGLYTRKGAYINLTSSSFCNMEVRAHMLQDNEDVGTIRIGIIPDPSIKGIQELEPDKEAIKSFIQKQINVQFPKDNVKVRDVSLYAA